MDIHKPKAAHSFREFLIEIGTITIGILIALSLDGLIEGHRAHVLVERARVNLRAELTRNRQDLAKVVRDAARSEGVLRKLIVYGEARLDHHPQPFPKDISLNGGFGTLSTSAWEGTLATQALTHMPYDEAQSLASVYSFSRAFNSLEERIETRWFELAAFNSDPARMANADVAKGLAELRVTYSYQATVVQTGTQLLKSYDDTLRVLR